MLFLYTVKLGMVQGTLPLRNKSEFPLLKPERWWLDSDWLHDFNFFLFLPKPKLSSNKHISYVISTINPQKYEIQKVEKDANPPLPGILTIKGGHFRCKGQWVRPKPPECKAQMRSPPPVHQVRLHDLWSLGVELASYCSPKTCIRF